MVSVPGVRAIEATLGTRWLELANRGVVLPPIRRQEGGWIPRAGAALTRSSLTLAPFRPINAVQFLAGGGTVGEAPSRAAAQTPAGPATRAQLDVTLGPGLLGHLVGTTEADEFFVNLARRNRHSVAGYFSR